MIRSLLSPLLALAISSAHAQTTLLPTTVSGGSGGVANIQQNDASSLSISRGQTSTIGGFGSFAGTINSVYLLLEYTPASNYAGNGAVKINGIDTPIIPTSSDRSRSVFIDITGGSYGIDTSAEINSLSVTFNNNGSGGQAGAIVFDYVYLLINPTLPILMPPTWSDEFEGTGPPNPANWVMEEGYKRNNELQYYMTSGNAWREGGNMVIEARKEPMNGYQYTSASMISSGKYSWKYGRAQIRAKIPALQGMWPAIWQVGVTKEWPSCGECDIMEYYQEKILANCAVGTSTQWVAQWYSSARSMSSLLAVEPNWRNDWHVWTMQWDEDYVRLYCDNILLNTIPQTSLKNPDGFEPFKQPHSIWLNLAVGGNGGGTVPAETPFPQRYLIDYWRIWEGYTQNSAPTDIALSSYEVGEDLPAGTTVGTLSVIDPDPAEVIKYTLVSGTGSTHNSQFTIPEFASDSTHTLVLKTNTPLSYADGATRSIRVRATDIEGATFDKILTIQVRQNISVSRNAFVIPENSTNTFQVRLMKQPASTVTLNVQRTSGDTNLSVQSGATLTFTPQNYATWQTVAIYAAVGPLTNNGVATFTCSDPTNVYGTQTITVTKVLQSNQVPVVDAGSSQSKVLDPAAALPSATAGSTIFLDANQDNGANTTWEDTLGKWSPTLDTNVTFLADAGSALKGITAAYEFPGGLSGSGGGSGSGLEGMSPRADNTPISVEMWFKPVASASYPTHGQVLWETGGDTGFGIFYRDGAVRASHDMNQGLMSVDVSQLTNEFIHLVVTYNTASSTDNYKIYVNGELRATQSRSDGDLSGADAAGLGKLGGTKAGGAGSAATTSFDGKIAKFRSYHNRILTAAEVFANYRAVVPSVSATLTGTITDPESQSVSGSWSVVSGPGPVVFLDPNALSTSAVFFTSGTYVLRLMATDGIYEIQDDVTITVTSPSVTRTLTYSGNGNTGGTAPTDASSPYASGSTVTVLGAGTLTKTGHSFAGWNTQANGGGTAYAAGDIFSINANTTLYAQWTPSTYTVTFNGNGGSNPSPATKQVTYGSTYGTLATTTRVGYSFNGWFTTSSGGDQVTDATSVTDTGNHTLHAQWSVTYTVSYLGNGNTGGTAPTDQQKVHNVALTLATNSGNLSKTGFSFMGWNTAADGTGTDYPEGFNYSANTPLTLYAKWTPGNNGTWNTDADGNWTDVLNWQGDTNYAGGADNTATLGNFITLDRIITLDAAITIGNITASDTDKNYTISGANTLTLDRTTGIPTIDVITSGRTLTISSNIAGTNGLQKNGAGTLTLGGINTYSGGTVLNAGTIGIGVDSQLGAANTDITFGGTANLSNSATIDFGSRAITLNAGTIATLGAGGTTHLTTAGVVTGSGNLVWNSNRGGILTLSSSSNTFTGALSQKNVNAYAGSIVFNSIGDAPGAGAIIFEGNKGGNPNTADAGTYIRYTGTSPLTLNHRQLTLSSSTTTNSIRLFENNAADAAHTVTINTDLAILGSANATGFALGGTNAGANTFAGKLSDVTGRTLAFAKVGVGTWVLTGNNTYTGATMINAGILSVSKMANYGTDSAIGRGTAGTGITFGGGTLFYTGTGDDTNRLIQTSGGNGSILNNGTGALNFTATGNFNVQESTTSARTLTLGGTHGGTISGAIQNNNSGTIALTKIGSGTWTLGAANIYTGTTTVSEGKLFINGDQTLATGNVGVAANATLGGTGIIGGNTTISNNGRLEFDLSTNATSHNKLELATGKTLTFSGTSTLTITSGGGAGIGSYVLLSAPGGITGNAPATLVLPSGWAATVSKVGTDLVLNVSSVGALTPFEQWAASSGLSGGNAASGTDPDGDGWINLQEFAFGTNPTAGHSGSLEFIPGGDVTNPGMPVLRGYTPPQGSPPFQAVFGRRKNHADAGITYTAEFSANLTYWAPSNSGASILTGEGSHEIEVVAVPFPETVPLSEGGTQAPPKFFRIRVSTTP